MKPTKDLRTLLPGKVKVGGYTYAQHLVARDHPALELDEEKPSEYENDAVTDFEQHTIHYASALKLAGLLNSVIHEIQHCINHVYGVGEKEEEERVATQSANGWMQVFLDNPRLLSWINRAVKQVKKESK